MDSVAPTSTAPQQTLRITRLVETNHKRISSLVIEPGRRTLVILQGGNEQGKTSALEGLIALLGGKKRSAEVPIRKGADSCIIEGTISVAGGPPLYEVVRSFKGDKTYLSLYSLDSDGNRTGKMSAGQTLLDSLVSDITFDPLAFSRGDGNTQIKMLCSAIGKPDLMAQAKARRDAIADSRRTLNTERDQLQARLNQPDMVDPAPGTALHEITPDGVKARLDAAQAKNNERDAVSKQIDSALAAIINATGKLSDFAEQLKKLQESIAKWEEYKTKAEALRDNLRQKLAGMAEISTTEILAQLQQIDQDNAKARQQKARTAALVKLTELDKQIGAYTEQLKQVDTRVEQEIAASDLGKAVPGLAFTDGELVHNGLPWSQASGMRKLVLSSLIGMAANPQLRIMTIDEADRLDDEALKELQKLAAERGFQLWMTGVRLGDETDEDTYIAKIVNGTNVNAGPGGGVATGNRSDVPSGTTLQKPRAQEPAAVASVDDLEL